MLLSAILCLPTAIFPVRLPADWDGTDGRIAEAFNQTIASEDRITQEVTRLSITVGKEGALEARAPSRTRVDRRLGG